MGFQGNAIGHLRFYAGREEKGWRLGQMKRGLDVCITCRAYLPSCSLSRASCPPCWHHTQEGPDPLCLVLPVCDFAILPLKLITDLELTADFILSTIHLGWTTDRENSLTGIWKIHRLLNCLLMWSQASQLCRRSHRDRSRLQFNSHRVFEWRLLQMPLLFSMTRAPNQPSTSMGSHKFSMLV